MTKLRNIEFLRIFFASALVYYHIFHSNILKFIKDENLLSLCNKMAANSALAHILVEGFVLIAGFFLFYSIKRKGNMTFGQFMINKLVRLYPVLAFSILCLVFLHFFGVIKLNFYTQFLNLITLQSIGVNLDYKGITWFISPFFWGMMFIYGAYKTFDKKVFHFILALSIYFSFVILVENGFGRETIGFAFNLGILRMIASLGLGYFLSMFYEKIKNAKIFTNHKITTFIFFSFAEIAAFIFIVYYTLLHRISYKNNFIFIPVFVILIFSFAMNKGILSKIFNLRIFEILGQYAYSIYVMQQVAFYLLGLFLWKQTSFLEHHFAITIILSLLFSQILGTIVYYAIEYPITNRYKSFNSGKTRERERERVIHFDFCRPSFAFCK